MPNESLNTELQTFIGEYVHSVEQLEILCLLAGANSKTWTPSEVFRTIQSSEQSVTRCLESFRKVGVLLSKTSGTYEFAPSRPELARLSLELAKAYRERRVAVIETIYQRPGDTIQDFADAFKLRKDK